MRPPDLKVFYGKQCDTPPFHLRRALQCYLPVNLTKIEMRVTILGCSGGIEWDLRTTCLMVDDDILIDVGTGAGDLTRDEMLRIKAVFLTHSHLDHIALLPMLVNLVGRSRSAPLMVYALPETISILQQHIFNFSVWPDFTLLPTPAKPYMVFRELTVGETLELAERRITPLPVRHSVPGVAYQLDSGKASFVFSGDTDFHLGFWIALGAIENLRYLMMEITFHDHETDDADVSGHMRPGLLASGLEYLDTSVHLLITHMWPGSEDTVMAEVRKTTGAFIVKRLQRGQIFEL